MENKFMRVEEVAEVLEVSTSFAYKVIRQLNDEVIDKMKNTEDAKCGQKRGSKKRIDRKTKIHID